MEHLILLYTLTVSCIVPSPGTGCYKEYLEDYDFTLHYYPSKANIVADALSRKSRGVLASVASQEWQILETVG